MCLTQGGCPCCVDCLWECYVNLKKKYGLPALAGNLFAWTPQVLLCVALFDIRNILFYVVDFNSYSLEFSVGDISSGVYVNEKSRN